MKISGKEISVSTNGFSDIVDITNQVQKCVSDARVTEGLANVFIVGSTASVSTIEFEPALAADFKEKLEEFMPHDRRTRHGDTWGDDNGFSHVRATFMGPGITVPIHAGDLVLGTWQQIVVIDHDNRARQRKIFVQVMGE